MSHSAFDESVGKPWLFRQAVPTAQFEVILFLTRQLFVMIYFFDNLSLDSFFLPLFRYYGK